MGTPISGKPGLVGPLGDGSPAEVGVDAFGSLLVAEKGPKYLEWTRRGYMYTTLTSPAAPIALPIYSTATNSPTLWNPPGSGKMVVPVKLHVAVADAGDRAAASVILSYTPAAAEVATGGTFATFTNIVPVNCLLNGPACKARYAGAVVTWTTQPTAFMHIPVQVGINILDGSRDGSWVDFDFEGAVILPPGTAISVTTPVAFDGTYLASFIFAELPLPAGV